MFSERFGSFGCIQNCHPSRLSTHDLSWREFHSCNATTTCSASFNLVGNSTVAQYLLTDGLTSKLIGLLKSRLLQFDAVYLKFSGITGSTFVLNVGASACLPDSVWSHPSAKGKIFSLQAYAGPWGSGRLRLPDFLDFRHDEGGKVVTLTHGPSLPPGVSWYSYLEAESTPGHMVPTVASEKIPSNTTGDRSRDPPNSNAVP